MKSFSVHPIGTIRADAEGFRVELEEEYKAALRGLEGFGCIQLLWWFDGCDNEASRSVLALEKPYKKGPDELGVFATRSPQRPNPLALSCAGVTYIDPESGVIGLAYIDARDGSPVLDIKPYTPSLDRVESPSLPAWCTHWPRCTEDSGDFDWESEFNF